MNKKYISYFAVLALVLSLAISTTAFAQTNGNDDQGDQGHGRPMVQATVGANVNLGGQHGPRDGKPGMRMGQGIFGTVTAVGSNSLTVTGQKGPGKNATTTTTFTVDASNAMVRKGDATSTVSAIAVGDKVMVLGNINGSSVTAKEIRDGVMVPGMKDRDDHMGSSTMAFQGNGQPVVGGKVTVVGSSSLTITNRGNQTFTIDATNAVVKKGDATSTLSNVVVNDEVIVQGTVNGSSITASTIIDRGVMATSTNQMNNHPKPRGFWGGIASFFGHLFGF